jgi:hypothetical protein
MAITNFDKVELLLPMTGANNGTVFTDYSLRQRTVTQTGAVTSTAQSKFSAYGSSGFFDGTDDRLTLPSTFGHLFAGNDFCIEGYARAASLASTTKTIMSQRSLGTSNHAFSFYVPTSGSLDFATGTAAGNTNNVIASSSGGVVTIDNWFHFAATRSGTSLRLFHNGTEVASGTLNHNIHASSEAVSIGAMNTTAANFWNGYMQDVCVTIGAAKYTANFTPPPRMTQRELTRTNTGIDSHEYDRAVLFDWNGGEPVARYKIPDASGDFAAADLIDLEYGVAFLKADYDPICRGPYAVDADA